MKQRRFLLYDQRFFDFSFSLHLHLEWEPRLTSLTFCSGYASFAAGCLAVPCGLEGRRGLPSHPPHPQRDGTMGAHLSSPPASQRSSKSLPDSSPWLSIRQAGLLLGTNPLHPGASLMVCRERTVLPIRGIVSIRWLNRRLSFLF